MKYFIIALFLTSCVAPTRTVDVYSRVTGEHLATYQSPEIEEYVDFGTLLPVTLVVGGDYYNRDYIDVVVR